MKDRQLFTFVGCILYKCLESIIQQDIYKVGSKVIHSGKSEKIRKINKIQIKLKRFINLIKMILILNFRKS